jgi:hypothetical protein
MFELMTVAGEPIPMFDQLEAVSNVPFNTTLLEPEVVTAG